MAMSDEQFARFERLEVFGIEITRKDWGVLLYRADPNGISGPSPQLVEVKSNDVVYLWPEVGWDDTPDGMDYGPDEKSTLDEFVQETYDALLQEEVSTECFPTVDTEVETDEGPGKVVKDLIVFMIGQGWERFSGSTMGSIRHANNHQAVYRGWFEAAKACIEVGSMMG